MQGFVVVYSIVDKDSFDAVDDLVHKIRTIKAWVGPSLHVMSALTGWCCFGVAGTDHVGRQQV
jgi:hypothetical protein